MKHEHSSRTLRINLQGEVIAEVHIGDHHFVPRTGDLFSLEFMDHVAVGKLHRVEAIIDRTFLVKNVLLEYVMTGDFNARMFRATLFLEDKERI